jgi:hypothetical protein
LVAGVGAFVLVDYLPVRRDILPGAAAMLLFAAVVGLMLKGVEAMRTERLQRLVKDAEERLEQQRHSK